MLSYFLKSFSHEQSILLLEILFHKENIFSLYMYKKIEKAAHVVIHSR